MLMGCLGGFHRQEEEQKMTRYLHKSDSESYKALHFTWHRRLKKVSVCETEVLFFLFQLTSQHPYAEVFIGRPHVWTVDLGNQEEVEDAVKAILSQKVVSFIPSSPLVM